MDVRTGIAGNLGDEILVRQPFSTVREASVRRFGTPNAPTQGKILC